MRNVKPIKGVCPIIPTAYTPNGEVDYDGVRNILRTRAAAGVDAFALFGIAGEYYKQTDAECEQLARVVAEECRSLNVPVVMSVTPHSTVAACRRAKFLEALGADCLMILPPFFLKPGAEAIYNHVRAIAQSVDIPVMVQYAPEQTGVAIAPEVWIRLAAECANAIYYKIECKPNGPYISKMMAALDPKPRILLGNCGYQMIEAFDRGAIGTMPCCAIAELYVKICREYFSGNRTKAIELHNKFLPLYNHIHQNVEMSVYYEKRIMMLRGVIASDHCRAPGFVPDKYMDALFNTYYEEIQQYL